MTISQNNPLGYVYRYWLKLGGTPREPEDLCHFMRVCMFWWWIRWFLKPRWVGGLASPFLILLYSATTTSVIVLWILSNRARIALSTIGVLALSLFIVFLLDYWTKDKSWRLERKIRVSQKRLAWAKKWDKREEQLLAVLKVFSAWASAKKKRICPFIKVEGLR